MAKTKTRKPLPFGTHLYRGKHIIPDKPLELRMMVSRMGIQVGWAYFQGYMGMPWEPAKLTVCDGVADGHFFPAEYDAANDVWVVDQGHWYRGGREVETPESALVAV